MLLLLFQIGADRYALDTAGVLEIVPWITLKKLARAPAGMAGLLDYHGAAVPVLDLRELTSGERSEPRFSTRLILIRAPLPPANTAATAVATRAGRHLSPVIGLLAERATGTLKREPSTFVETGLNLPGAPYLGPVIPDAEGFIQFVRVEGLLTGSVSTLLGGPAPAALEHSTPV